MSINIEKIKAYLAAHPVNLETADADSLMEELYWNYTQSNPSISDKVRSLNDQILPYLKHLNTEEIDELFGLFDDLCAEQEKLSFIGGLRFGMTLMLELLEGI